MLKRDIVASIAGAGVALAITMALTPAGRGIIGPAQAQQESASEHQRFLLLAIANAIASVAVDGERTALVLNETTDHIKQLEERLRNLEKRLAELEKKR